METDVNSPTSPTSTCCSDVSLSVGTTDSCVICFCSDEETTSHDCNVCRQGSWKVCMECKEKLKKLKKCPVCASENNNYISESDSEETYGEERREEVAIVRRNIGVKKNMLDIYFMYSFFFFRSFFCIIIE